MTMNKARITRWLASAAAGASIAVLPVLSGTAGASVSPTQLATHNVAGFQAHGNGYNYRYVQAQVTLPDITAASWQSSIPGGYGASLRLQDASQIADLGISTTPGSGVYNAAFALENSNSTYACTANGGPSPQVPAGDTVKMTLYYNYPGYTTSGPAGQLGYSVADLTHPADSWSSTCMDSGHWFSTARVVAGFTASDWADESGITAPAGNQRLVQFNNTVVTSRTGVRGSVGSAPWPVQRLAMLDTSSNLLASTPAAWGKIAVSPDNVVRDGRSFTVWMPSEF